ncbi:hypothetical protein AVEN_6777-1, partial [Araneus ventricosus]
MIKHGPFPAYLKRFHLSNSNYCSCGGIGMALHCATESSDGAGGRDAVRRGRVDGSRAHLRPRGRKPGPAHGGPLAPRRRPDPGWRREHQADPAQSDPGPE